MTVEIPALPREARRAILVGTAAITLASVAGSLFATLVISLAFGLAASTPAYLVAGTIPLMLAGPGSYMQLKRLEQIRAAYAELERVASTDWLTGLLNRRAFTAAVSQAALVGRPGALLVIDADGFKSINDQFGHDRGDDALRAIAGVIRSQVGGMDVVGRLGGEEFGVYLRDASESRAHDLAEAIREGVEDIAFRPGEAPHALSVSVGIATATAPAGFPHLFRVADQQLYAAKANGRNRVAIAAAGTDDDERAAA